MRYLIKNCKIIQKGNSWNGKRVDILVVKGIINKIGKDITDDKAKVIKSKNLIVSEGWLDLGTQLGEPGFEHRETFASLAESALAGGFTDIAPMPKSIPTIQTKAQLKNLIHSGADHGINILPIAALSQDLDGQNITEMVDLHNAGAVAFSDGHKSLANGGVLLRALQYVKRFNGLIIHHPNDATLNNDDLIHEGEISIQLGIKGSPSLAEELTVYRDLQLAEYSESKLNIHLISSKEALSLVKSSKKNNSNLTVGVSYLNLVKSDEDLQTFDSNLKVKPTLRSTKDRKALIKAIGDDTLDYICSNHVPLEIEKKQLEYSYASHGAIGLETCFAALSTHLSSNLDLENIVDKLSDGPRKVLGTPSQKIEEGAIAKITCFDPTIEWQYQKNDIKSLSKNSPFVGSSFIGKVVATFNKKTAFTS